MEKCPDPAVKSDMICSIDKRKVILNFNKFLLKIITKSLLAQRALFGFPCKNGEKIKD